MSDDDRIEEMLERHGSARVAEPDPVWAARLEASLRATHAGRSQPGRRGPALRPALVGIAAAAILIALVAVGLGRGEDAQDGFAGPGTVSTAPSTTEPEPQGEPSPTSAAAPAVEEPVATSPTTSPPATATPSTASAPTTAPTSAPGSAEPAELTVELRQLDDGTVEVRWSPYDGTDFAGWRVGRFSRDADGQPTVVYRSDQREPRRAVDDPPDEETGVYYVVVAVDAAEEVVARSQPTPLRTTPTLRHP